MSWFFSCMIGSVKFEEGYLMRFIMTAKTNKYTLIKIFAFGIMACTLLSGLIGCQSIDKKSNNNIKIESHEIEKGRSSVERVKSDRLSSEFLELNYSGDKTYQLDVEVWIEGNLVDTWTKFSDIHLAGYEGISFKIDENDESLLWDIIDLKMGLIALMMVMKLH